MLRTVSCVLFITPPLSLFHAPLLLNASVIPNHWELPKYSLFFIAVSCAYIKPAAWNALLPLNKFRVIHLSQLNNHLLCEPSFTSPV